MEGYLKNLLDDLAESNSDLADSNSSFRIVDDNFNSSFGSLKDSRRRRTRRRGSVRRANSTGAMVYKKPPPPSDESQDLDHSCSSLGSSRSIGFPESSTTKNNKKGVQLSARMERHRQNRWNATSAPCPPARHSLSPGVLRGRKRHTAVSNTEPLHSSLDLDTPKLSKNRQQRKAISFAIDKKDGQVLSDRFSTSSLSASLFEISDTTLSNESVINEAIAISDDIVTDITKANNSKTPRRRGIRGRRPKKNSLCLPPSMPVRRESIDDDFDDPLMDKLEGTKLKIPPVPVRRLSIDSDYDDSRSEIKGDQQIQIPIILRDLPYEKPSSQSI